MPDVRCRGIEIGPGQFSGCARGDGLAGPPDCPVCGGAGIEPDPLHPLGRCTCADEGTCPYCVRVGLVQASDLPDQLKERVGGVAPIEGGGVVDLLDGMITQAKWAPEPSTVMGRDVPEPVVSLETAALAALVGQLDQARADAAMWERECKRVTEDADRAYAELAVELAETNRLRALLHVDRRGSDR